MTADPAELVWYASYGSNCSARRFHTYLSGGIAPGATTAEPGARDPRPPRATAAHWFPRKVRFVGTSEKWGDGGVAFLDHADRGGRAPGRRYLITREQFADVAAQESRRESVELPIGTAEPGRVQPIGDRPYDGLLALTPVDGVPVATFTSPRPLDQLLSNAPTETYLRTIVRGLAEVHEMTPIALARAIVTASDLGVAWPVAKIAQLIEK